MTAKKHVPAKRRDIQARGPSAIEVVVVAPDKHHVCQNPKTKKHVLKIAAATRRGEQV